MSRGWKEVDGSSGSGGSLGANRAHIGGVEGMAVYLIQHLLGWAWLWGQALTREVGGGRDIAPALGSSRSIHGDRTIIVIINNIN